MAKAKAKAKAKSKAKAKAKAKSKAKAKAKKRQPCQMGRRKKRRNILQHANALAGGHDDEEEDVMPLQDAVAQGLGAGIGDFPDDDDDGHGAMEVDREGNDLERVEDEIAMKGVLPDSVEQQPAPAAQEESWQNNAAAEVALPPDAAGMDNNVVQVAAAAIEFGPVAEVAVAPEQQAPAADAPMLPSPDEAVAEAPAPVLEAEEAAAAPPRHAPIPRGVAPVHARISRNMWTDVVCDRGGARSGQFKLDPNPGLRDDPTWFARVRNEEDGFLIEF